MSKLFGGFQIETRTVDGLDIRLRRGGVGPPLLLHGYPQTHVMWHAVAPQLAGHFELICPGLRGYGDSGKPAADDDHTQYSKRAMANDAVELMRALGHERFGVAGHDRGARVVHRMLRDWPDRVVKACVMDIVPTLDLFEAIDQEFATASYHWFFLIQGGGFPERLIGADQQYFLREKLRRWSAPGTRFHPATFAEY